MPDHLLHVPQSSLERSLGRVSGAGLALAAKARYAPQPKLDPELVGLSMLNKDGLGLEGVDDVTKMA